MGITLVQKKPDQRQDELDSLQRTLNEAIDTLRAELEAASLPPLTLQATESHPLDINPEMGTASMYSARRKAVGASTV